MNVKYFDTRDFTDGGNGHSYAAILVFANKMSMRAYEKLCLEPFGYEWGDTMIGVASLDEYTLLESEGRSLMTSDRDLELTRGTSRVAME